MKNLLFEVTHQCNLKCPNCFRTILNSQGKFKYSSNSLSFEMIKDIFRDTSKMRDLRSVKFVGNIGDALVHPKIFDILSYISKADLPSLQKIYVSTNGSMRDEKFFAELATIDKLVLVFTIDGLEDTHSNYRIGSNFNKVLRNAKSYIDNNGYANMDTIGFKYVIPVLSDIRAMALEMGFRDVILKPPRGNPRSDQFYKNVAKENKISFKESFKSKCSCMHIDNDEYFIDSFGNVLPCCWSGGETYEIMAGLRDSNKTVYGALTFDKNLNNMSINSIIDNYERNRDAFMLHLDNNMIPLCNKTCLK